MQLVNNQTMSSLEIAQLTEKEHFNVRRDIANMLETLKLDVFKFEGIYFDSSNREQKYYLLPYDETVCLLTGYDVVARMKVIKRWKELEQINKIQLPDFSNPAIAARAWADEVEAKQDALLKLEAAKPSIEFVDKYVESTGLKGFRQVAKLLSVKENELRTFLADNGHAFNSAKFTSKGIQWLAGEIAKSKVEVN